MKPSEVRGHDRNKRPEAENTKDLPTSLNISAASGRSIRLIRPDLCVHLHVVKLAVIGQLLALSVGHHAHLALLLEDQTSRMFMFGSMKKNLSLLTTSYSRHYDWLPPDF